MGDDNIESGLLWADEDIDGTAVYDNPDLVDDSDNNDDDGDNNSGDDDDAADKTETSNSKVSAENKSLKRKEKFEKLKKVKKTKHEENMESESSEVSARSAESMAQMIMASEPIANINASKGDVTLSIPESCYFDPSKSLHAPAKSSCVFVNSIAASIPAFRKALNAETKSSDENGSPIVLVVCASAHRSTDIINSMSNGLKCKIAKLFAKHFKVQDQIDLLSKQYFPVAVGTPNRLSKLIELGALSLSRVKVLLIDIAEDEKKFTILTMPLVKEDFYSFLLKSVQPEMSHIKISLVEGKIYEAKTTGSTDAEKSDHNVPSNSRKGKSRFNKGKFSTARKGF